MICASHLTAGNLRVDQRPYACTSPCIRQSAPAAAQRQGPHVGAQWAGLLGNACLAEGFSVSVEQLHQGDGGDDPLDPPGPSLKQGSHGLHDGTSAPTFTVMRKSHLSPFTGKSPDLPDLPQWRAGPDDPQGPNLPP